MRKMGKTVQEESSGTPTGTLSTVAICGESWELWQGDLSQQQWDKTGNRTADMHQPAITCQSLQPVVSFSTDVVTLSLFFWHFWRLVLQFPFFSHIRGLPWSIQLIADRCQSRRPCCAREALLEHFQALPLEVLKVLCAKVCYLDVGSSGCSPQDVHHFFQQILCHELLQGQ